MVTIYLITFIVCHYKKLEQKCIDKIIFMTKKTPDQEKLTDIIARTILHTMYNNGNLVM